MKKKLLPALTGVEKVDRLAIIVTFQGKEQLLGVPEIQTSSGEEQAMGAYQAEKLFNRDLLYLPCRHHIF